MSPNGQLFKNWAFAWWSNIEPLTDPFISQIKAQNLWDVIWILGTHCSACFKCLPWVTYYSNFNNPFTESGVLEQKNIQNMLGRAARNWCISKNLGVSSLWNYAVVEFIYSPLMNTWSRKLKSLLALNKLVQTQFLLRLITYVFSPSGSQYGVHIWRLEWCNINLGLCAVWIELDVRSQ